VSAWAASRMPRVPEVGDPDVVATPEPASAA
jgi:hypothetical protein